MKKWKHACYIQLGMWFTEPSQYSGLVLVEIAPTDSPHYFLELRDGQNLHLHGLATTITFRVSTIKL